MSCWSEGFGYNEKIVLKISLFAYVQNLQNTWVKVYYGFFSPIAIVVILRNYSVVSC